MSHVEFLQIPGDFNQIELPPYYERESSVHMPKAHPSDHTYTNTLTCVMYKLKLEYKQKTHKQIWCKCEYMCECEV